MLGENCTQSTGELTNNFTASLSTSKIISEKYLTFVIDIPFRHSDPGKMLRFQSYVLEKEGQLVTFDVPNNMMTGSQIKHENIEFDKLKRLNKIAMESGQIMMGDKYSRSVYTSEMKNLSDSDI